MIRVRDDTSTAETVKGDSVQGEQRARRKAGEANGGPNQRQYANSKCSNIAKRSDSAVAARRSRCARRRRSRQRLDFLASRDVPRVPSCAIVTAEHSRTSGFTHDTGRVEVKSNAL